MIWVATYIYLVYHLPRTLGTLLCGALCYTACEELDCDDLMYDFNFTNCTSWKRARIFRSLTKDVSSV